MPTKTFCPFRNFGSKNLANCEAGYCGFERSANRLTHQHTFYFHLKEYEFRFNYRGEDIYKMVLKMPWEYPLSQS
jgi:hypothetical protein